MGRGVGGQRVSGWGGALVDRGYQDGERERKGGTGWSVRMRLSYFLF